MSSDTEKIAVIADFDGRILAAQLPGNGERFGKEQAPTSRIAALDGQRELHINLPREILALQGPDLHRFFSSLKIRLDGEVELPKIKIERMRKK